MRYGRWILALALAGAGSAQAAGIGVRAGTTGLGADFGWSIAPTLGGRIGLSGLNFDTDFDTGGVSYDAKAKLANLNLLLDWSPLGLQNLLWLILTLNVYELLLVAIGTFLMAPADQNATQ